LEDKIMSKKSGTIEREPPSDWEKPHSRQEIEKALARLQEIAESLPPIDVVSIIREGRDVGANSTR
jgi:hypothetical protein